jgi:HSP20 family protein
MMSLQRQMDQLFDRMWRGDVFDIAAPDASSAVMPAFKPTFDVRETDSHYLMTFELPGVKKEDIRIDLNDGMLTVSGERKEEMEESCDQKGQNHYHAESFYGAFSRSFRLPANIKAEQIETSYSDGVLRLAVPRVQPSKGQSIQIGEGKAHFWDKLLGRKDEQNKPAAPTKAA